jgi:effector-binding domain-containing protein
MKVKLRLISDAKIEYRNKQNYAAIWTNVMLKQIHVLLPPLIPEVAMWLEKKNIKPAGSPFFRYLKMDNELEVEIGFPVELPISGDERISPGGFLAGKYAVVKYFGHYNKLYEAHTELEKLSDKNKIKKKGGHTEFYPTDPALEPDPNKWETIIISQLDDEK